MPDDPPRVLLFRARGLTWADRAAAVAWIALVLLIAALVILPALILGVAAFLLAAAWFTLRRIAARARPDGRSNVRVISPEDR